MSQKTNLMILRKWKRNALIRSDAHYKKYEKLIIKQVQKHQHRDSYDELMSTASMGYIKAIDTFDPEKGQFSTHLHWTLRSILDKHKKINKTQHITIDDPFNELHNNGGHLVDRVTPLNVYTFYEMIDNLSPPSKEIIDIIFSMPVELITSAREFAGGCRIKLSSIRRYLRKKGWNQKIINNCILEIKEALE